MEGLQATIDRSKAYIDAGADMIFPEGLTSLKEFEEVANALRAHARPVIQPAAGLEVAGLRLAAVVAPCLFGLAGRLVDLDGGDVCTARDGPACSWWWGWSVPRDGNE